VNEFRKNVPRLWSRIVDNESMCQQSGASLILNLSALKGITFFISTINVPFRLAKRNSTRQDYSTRISINSLLCFNQPRHTGKIREQSKSNSSVTLLVNFSNLLRENPRPCVYISIENLPALCFLSDTFVKLTLVLFLSLLSLFYIHFFFTFSLDENIISTLL